MKELSFWDKLKVLFDNILAHPLFTLLIFVPIVIYFLHKRHGKKVFIIVYFLVIFSILLAFGDVIFKLFDNLMDGIFMTLYFPNFITLFSVVLLTSIFALITIFSTKMYKINKIINYVSFGIIHMLFVLILITIKINKINVYKSNALYTNSDVLSLMQLLVGMFVLQMISIFIISMVNRTTEKLDNRFSKDTTKQIENLNRKAIKTFRIDNNKVGFINVADTKVTSKPKLKPFKFDIKKIESINLEVSEKPRLYNVITLKNNLFSYLNEMIKSKKFKLVNLDLDKIGNIELNGKIKDKKPFNKKTLENKDFNYLNEIVKSKKYKSVKLDLNKTGNIELNGKIKDKKPFNKVSVLDKSFSYLNEIINKKKYKSVDLNQDKLNSVELNGKIKDKRFNKVSLNLNKPYLINIKPDLMKPMTFNKRFISNKVLIIENPMVKNFKIIDMQSAIDMASKYCLIKEAKLKGFDNVLTIDNLKINNFDLLLKILKKYKVHKKYN